MGYDERHLVTDSKIALGLLAVGLALAAPKKLIIVQTL